MTREEAIKIINNFPVESTGEREAVVLSIKALEQEPCDKCEVANPCLYCKHEFEPKMGRWIAMKALDIYTIGYFCSECNLIVTTKKRCAPFCPSCGAKMEFEPGERSEKK